MRTLFNDLVSTAIEWWMCWWWWAVVKRDGRKRPPQLFLRSDWHGGRYAGHVRTVAFHHRIRLYKCRYVFINKLIIPCNANDVLLGADLKPNTVVDYSRSCVVSITLPDPIHSLQLGRISHLYIAIKIYIDLHWSTLICILELKLSNNECERRRKRSKI
jgi:hypothetical protein